VCRQAHDHLKGFRGGAPYELKSLALPHVRRCTRPRGVPADRSGARDVVVGTESRRSTPRQRAPVTSPPVPFVAAMPPSRRMAHGRRVPSCPRGRAHPRVPGSLPPLVVAGERRLRMSSYKCSARTEVAYRLVSPISCASGRCRGDRLHRRRLRLEVESMRPASAYSTTIGGGEASSRLHLWGDARLEVLGCRTAPKHTTR